MDYALNDYYDSELGGFVDVPHQQVKYPEELVELFKKYAKGETAIGLEGVIEFINDLGLQLEDLVTICLAKLLSWKKLTDPITEEQFLSSWYMQGCSHITEMKVVMKDLEKKLYSDRSYLGEVYDYTFDLILDEGKSTLDMDTAIEYWKLYFCQDLERSAVIKIDPRLFSDWIIFLESDSRDEISKDCWHMVLIFFERLPSLEDVAAKYNENDAWPFIIDEFYEYLQDTKGI